MIYLSICGTLFIIIAAMHLLAMAKKEELGSFFKWVSYFILIIASLLLVCQLSRGFCKMMHGKKCGKEKTGMGCMSGQPMRGMWKHGHHDMKCDESCEDGMKNAGGCMKEEHGKKECCKEEKEGCEENHEDSMGESMHHGH